MEHRHLWPEAVGKQEPTQRRQSSYCLVFDAFRLDLRDERLWCGQEVLHLHPKTFAVLRCLVTQAGQLVTKDALLAAVWPEMVVSDAVLTVAIRALRRVLGDQARTPRFIETVHGRGYPFIALVQALASPDGPAVMGALHHTPPPHFRRPPHYVGRDTELAQLTQWWTSARQGTRQVGVIAGEPGIGMTALVEAFLAQVAAGGACRVGHGQCIEPYGPGEPYMPILEALGRLCRAAEGPSLVSVLWQYAPSWLVQLPALVPPAEREALQHTVGQPVQTRMLRELTEALDALTTECPLVLVLEDLHWSDRATLEWLAYDARRPDPARLLLLGTYRPVDAMVQAHPLRAVLTELQQYSQCMELALDSLSEGEVTAYLRQRFGDTRLAADLARVLHQRTQGNPLFLIAIVDELMRQQVAREGPAGWDMRAGVETIRTIIPTTLRALLEHQLAHCSPEAQTLLAAASVAGVEFAAAAVAAGLERTDDEIEAQCATLAHQGQFLEARGRAEWPDGTVTACFGFRHALYHDLLYQRIPAGRQSRLHARIGARLAQGFGAQAGDLAAALAMHFVRGRMMSQAVTYCQQAGASAYDRAAFCEAVAYFEQALQALAHLHDHGDTRVLAIELCLGLGGSLNALGEYGRHLARLDEAEALAWAVDDRARLGRVLARLAHVRRITGDSDGAIAAGQQALDLATALGDSALQMQAFHTLGQAYNAIGDFGRAAELLRRNVEAADRESGTTSTNVRSESRAWLALTLGALGAFAEGRRHGEEALRLATLEGRGAIPIIAHGCLGLLYLAKGDLEHAIRVFDQGLTLCRTSGHQVWLRVIMAGMGYTYAFQGRFAEGRVLLEEAISESISTGFLQNRSLWVAWLSEVYRLMGHSEETWQYAFQALDLARQQKECGNEASRCTSLAPSMPTPPPLMSHRPKPTTGKPWLWPRNWACAPSRPIATTAWECCISRRSGRTRLVLCSPRPSPCTAPWR
jgi:DNA-binding winged helix-turn-helix (wHTH) protein/tetratricopeptide (TPR) repeat protein